MTTPIGNFLQVRNHSWMNTRKIELHKPRRESYLGPQDIASQTPVLQAASIVGYNANTYAYNCAIQSINPNTMGFNNSGYSVLAYDFQKLSGLVFGNDRRLKNGTKVMVGLSTEGNIIFMPDIAVQFGAPTAAWGSGTLNLTPCDAGGTANGQDDVAPTILGENDISSYDAGGGSTSTGCTIPTTAIVQYYEDDSGGLCVLGETSVQVVKSQYDATSHQYQVKVQFCVGGALSTISGWLPVATMVLQDVGKDVRYNTSTNSFQYRTMQAYLPENVIAGSWTDLATSEESKTTPCNAPGS